MLVSIADAKTYLGISDNSKDALLTLLITAVGKSIETYCGRTFASTVFTNEEYDGGGTKELRLKNYPVTTFTKLERNKAEDNSDDWEEIDSEDYWVDLNSGIITRSSGFLDFEPTEEEGLSSDSYFWGKSKYRATYTAGFATVPTDIQLAVLISVADLYSRGKAPNVKSESLGDHSITFADSSSINNKNVKAILDMYREPNCE